ncbi:DDE_3 domain-containing protein [Trichonephila clavipes]|nr:DDE_3 domain-containing protein [Trichonephila clavipes]
MEWPARSPDLNSIEHLWDYLGREVAALNPPPRSLHELKQGLLCVWSSLPIPVRNEKKRVCKEKLTDATAGGTKLEPALTLIPVLMRVVMYDTISNEPRCVSNDSKNFVLNDLNAFCMGRDRCLPYGGPVSYRNGLNSTLTPDRRLKWNSSLLKAYGTE